MSAPRALCAAWILASIYACATDVEPSTQLSITTNPSGEIWAGERFKVQPVVQLLDAARNPVPEFGVQITVSVKSGDGQLTGATSVHTSTNGAATFVDLSLDGAQADHVLEFSAPGTTPVTVPVRLQTFVDIGAGITHTCGLTQEGAVHCWGDDGENRTNVRTRVEATVVFSKLAVGAGRTCALVAAGRVHCWGASHLGGGLTTPSKTPFQTSNIPFANVAVGEEHNCLLNSVGNIFCWGANDEGQLGNGATSTTPTTTFGTMFGQGNTFSFVAAGYDHTCAINSAFVAHCWGSNFRGQLGNPGAPGHTVAAVQTSVLFASLAAGGRHTCGLTAAGQAHCWGEAVGGGSDAPAPVAGGVAFAQIRAGARHTCALTATSALYCWGFNEAGQLGTGTASPGSATPLLIDSGIPFSKLALGRDHTCALTTTAVAVYCWGFNPKGQLGDGTTIDRLVPVRVRGP